MVTLSKIFKDMDKLFKNINDFFDYDIFRYTRVDVYVTNGDVNIQGKLKRLVINGYTIQLPGYVRTTQKGDRKK